MNNLTQKILNILIKITFAFAIIDIVLLILIILGVHSLLLDLIAPSADFFVPRTYREIKCNILPSLLSKISLIVLFGGIVSIIIFVIGRRKKELRINRKLLITSLIFGSIVLFMVTTIFFCWARAGDSFRTEEMHLMVRAQELYYYDNGKYFTHDGSDDGTPTIGKYLQALDDPKAPERHYKWLNNNVDIQGCTKGEFYCAYATFESKGNCHNVRYFAASENGNKELCDEEPAYGPNDCECW